MKELLQTNRLRRVGLASTVSQRNRRVFAGIIGVGGGRKFKEFVLSAEGGYDVV